MTYFSAQLGWVDAKDEDDNEDDNEDNEDDDGVCTIFQLGRVGSEREMEENKIFTVRGQMEPPEESAV